MFCAIDLSKYWTVNLNQESGFGDNKQASVGQMQVWSQQQKP